MIQTDLWMLTPFFVFTLIKISPINADNKSQRKLNDQEENYIITHYGREYYTPATDPSVQVRKTGYFTAEVIPVDVNTGEELKTVKNIFVPMHTGYSIAANDKGRNTNHNKINGNKIDASKQTTSVISSPQWNGDAAAETATKENVDSKSKIPKKFKNKLAYATKNKKIPTEFNESNASDKATESVQNIKKIPKRHVGEIPHEFFPHLFDRRFEMHDRRWNRMNYFY